MPFSHVHTGALPTTGEHQLLHAATEPVSTLGSHIAARMYGHHVQILGPNLVFMHCYSFISALFQLNWAPESTQSQVTTREASTPQAHSKLSFSTIAHICTQCPSEVCVSQLPLSEVLGTCRAMVLGRSNLPAFLRSHPSLKKQKTV